MLDAHEDQKHCQHEGDCGAKDGQLNGRENALQVRCVALLEHVEDLREHVVLRHPGGGRGGSPRAREAHDRAVDKEHDGQGPDDVGPQAQGAARASLHEGRHLAIRIPVRELEDERRRREHQPCGQHVVHHELDRERVREEAQCRTRLAGEPHPRKRDGGGAEKDVAVVSAQPRGKAGAPGRRRS